VLGLALAGSAALGVRAQDDRPPPPPTPAAKPAPWEYKVVALEFREYRETDEWKEQLAKHDKNELKADAAFKEYALNYWAKEGWELVQVLLPKPEMTVCYLRRQR
jgi:hypothetical protein